MLKDPSKHHAVHLATIRDRCAKNPAQILKNYHIGKLQKQAEKKDDQIPMEALSSLEKIEDNPGANIDSDSNKKSVFSGLFTSNKKASKFAV